MEVQINAANLCVALPNVSQPSLLPCGSRVNELGGDGSSCFANAKLDASREGKQHDYRYPQIHYDPEKTLLSLREPSSLSPSWASVDRSCVEEYSTNLADSLLFRSVKLNSSARACNPQASSLLPHCSSPARKIESFYATAEDPNAASSNTESSFADPTAVMASINRSKNAEKENALQKRLPNYCSETLLPVLSSTSLFRDLQQKHRPSKKEYPNIDCPATRLGLAATTATTSCTTTATTTATFEDSSTVSPDQHAEHQIVPALRHQLAGQHGSFSQPDYQEEASCASITEPTETKDAIKKRPFLKKGSRNPVTALQKGEPRKYRYYAQAVAEKLGPLATSPRETPIENTKDAPQRSSTLKNKVLALQNPRLSQKPSEKQQKPPCSVVHSGCNTTVQRKSLRPTSKTSAPDRPQVTTVSKNQSLASSSKNLSLSASPLPLSTRKKSREVTLQKPITTLTPTLKKEATGLNVSAGHSKNASSTALTLNSPRRQAPVQFPSYPKSVEHQKQIVLPTSCSGVPGFPIENARLSPDVQLLTAQAQAKMATIDEQLTRLREYEQTLQQREALLTSERETFYQQLENQRLQMAAERESQLSEIEQARRALKKDQRRWEGYADVLEQLKSEKDALEEQNRKLRLLLAQTQEDQHQREERYQRLVDRLGGQISNLERKNKSLTEALDMRLKRPPQTTQRSTPCLTTKRPTTVSRSRASEVSKAKRSTRRLERAEQRSASLQRFEQRQRDCMKQDLSVKRLAQSTPIVQHYESSDDSDEDSPRIRHQALSSRSSQTSPHHRLPSHADLFPRKPTSRVGHSSFVEQNPVPYEAYSTLLRFDLNEAWRPFDDALLPLRKQKATVLQQSPVTKPDGRQELIYLDGKLQRRGHWRTNGSILLDETPSSSHCSDIIGHREVVFANGLRKVICPANNWVFHFFQNGDIRGVSPSGYVFYYFHQETIYSITHPDGTVFNSFTDGQVDARFPDGTTQVRFPQGMLKQVDPDGTEHIQLEQSAKNFHVEEKNVKRRTSKSVI